MSITSQRSVQKIPLSSLVLSKHNMRTGKAIEPEFVESVFINGLIQPILVMENDDSYEVAAGRRRLNALNKLASEERIPKDYPVPCLVSDCEDELRALSFVENFHKSDPHPSMYYSAVRELQKEGMAKNEICDRLQIDTIKFEQIIRLANIHSKIFKSYAAGDLSEEQIRAFGASSNKRRQIDVWAEADYSLDIRPHVIRTALLGDVTSSSPLALYVGLDAYEENGGSVTKDLFGDSNALHDEELLIKLAKEKLEQEHDIFVEQNPDWKWTLLEVPGVPTSEIVIRGRYWPKYKAKTTEQKALINEIELEFKMFNDIDPYDMSPEQDEAYEALENKLRDQESIIDNENAYYLKREMRASGVIIVLDDDGKVEYRKGLQTKEDIAELKSKEKKKKDLDAAKASDDQTTESNQDYSQALKSDIDLYRRSIIKADILAYPQLAVELLNYSCIVDKLSTEHYWGPRLHDLSIRATANETTREDYDSSKMNLVMEGAYKKLSLDWLDLESETARIKGYLSLTAKQKQSLLAYVSALSIDSDVERYIEKETSVDYRKYFTPQSENYFSRIPKPILLDHYNEITDKKPDDTMLKSSKRDLVTILSGLFQGKGANKTWVPPLFKKTDEKGS